MLHPSIPVQPVAITMAIVVWIVRSVTPAVGGLANIVGQTAM